MFKIHNRLFNNTCQHKDMKLTYIKLEYVYFLGEKKILVNLPHFIIFLKCFIIILHKANGNMVILKLMNIEYSIVSDPFLGKLRLEIFLLVWLIESQWQTK